LYISAANQQDTYTSSSDFDDALAAQNVCVLPSIINYFPAFSLANSTLRRRVISSFNPLPNPTPVQTSTPLLVVHDPLETPGSAPDTELSSYAKKEIKQREESYASLLETADKTPAFLQYFKDRIATLEERNPFFVNLIAQAEAKPVILDTLIIHYKNSPQDKTAHPDRVNTPEEQVIYDFLDYEIASRIIQSLKGKVNQGFPLFI
jgi:hypothetical protein